MCIAIYHDEKCFLTEEEFKNSWNSNPDGGGFMYFNDAKEIVIEKSMLYTEMYRKYYDAIEKYSDSSPFAVHFRIATHGSVNIDNCHPFRASAHTAVMHNGIIPVLMEKKDKRSDTRVFVQEYMSRLPATWLDDDYLFSMVEQFVGGSKLIIMTNDPKLESYLYILNEKDGHWNEEKTKWYSNRSYCNSSSSVFGKYSSTQQYSLDIWDDNPIVSPLGKCVLCDDDAVLDNVCYNCETCMSCYLNEQDCECYSSISGMTDDQWRMYDTKQG
jgi:predicted glutamine amidotransferase